MKINSQFFILLFIVLFFKCTKQINSPTSNYEISFILGDKLLRIQDSTTVDINIADYNDSNFVINWSTNIGNIKGVGDKVRYIAPNNKGLAIIKTEITDRYNDTYTDSIEILIYKQLIFLKADDLVFDNSNIVSARWRSFINFIELKKIKGSLGLIGNSLEKGNNAYYSYLRNVAAYGYFEIWNHGYNHLLNGIDGNGDKFHEFWNTSYEYQKEHLIKTQYLAKEKLNITLHTFGAPGNGIDNNTLEAIEEIGDLNVWYFGLENYSKLNLMRFVEIEYPVHNPDFQKFQTNYDEQKLYIALQIHPNSWDENRFSEFKNIIEFLIQNDVTFITPYEYYQLLN